MIRHEDIDDGPLKSKIHKVCCWPQCCLPCNFILYPCRHAVSRKKRRFIEDGFDLDLTYLTPRIIIHGFPATGIEHLYRNPRYELRRLLDMKHKDHYMVYNFCCEPGRGYEPNIFHGRVKRFPFKDHNTPPLATLVAFANDAKAWLEADERNVCSLHCKAGKGRAGLMACVLMLRTGVAESAIDAMDKYDVLRTHNNRGLTVTSQRKYVIFYETLWRQYWNTPGNLGQIPADKPEGEKFIVPEEPQLRLRGIRLFGSQTASMQNLIITVYQGTNFSPEMLYTSAGETGKDNKSWSCDCTIKGNFKIFIQSKTLFKTKKLFEMWHNTLFMELDEAGTVDFGQDQMDIKRSMRAKIGDDIVIRLYFGAEGIATPAKEVVPEPNKTNQVATTDDVAMEL